MRSEHNSSHHHDEVQAGHTKRNEVFMYYKVNNRDYAHQALAISHKHPFLILRHQKPQACAIFAINAML